MAPENSPERKRSRESSPRDRHKSSEKKRYGSGERPPPIQVKYRQSVDSEVQLTVENRDLDSGGVRLDPGSIRLDSGPYHELLNEFLKKNDPRELRLKDFNTEILWDMGRTSRLLLLKHLSESSVRIRLQIGRNTITEKTGDEVDLATLLVLWVALRGDSKLLGELIGLSKLTTVELLIKYMEPPLVSSDVVFHLAHATARNVTQPRAHNGGAMGSFELFRHVPPIIASALSDLSEGKVGNLKSDIEKLITEWEDDDDRGIQIGLVLVGFKISLRKAINEGRLEHVDLLLKVVFGALSGVPVGGFAFSAAQPFFEKWLKHKERVRNDTFTEVWHQVWMTVQRAVDEKIPRYNAQDLERYDKYEKWLNRVLAYEPPPL